MNDLFSAMALTIEKPITAPKGIDISATSIGAIPPFPGSLVINAKKKVNPPHNKAPNIAPITIPNI